MEAGYRTWSHVDEFEAGGIRVCADLGNGNLMCFAAGMVYNSADGIWRLGAVQALELIKDDTVWTDGMGGRHFFRNGCDADGMGLRIENEGGRARISDEVGNKLVFLRDGSLERAEIAATGEMEFVYTGGLLTAVNGPAGRRVIGYEGDRCSVIAGDGLAFFEYEGDKLTGVRYGNGDEASFEYEKGRLACVRAGGKRLDMEYDGAGRALRIGDREYGYFSGESRARDCGGDDEWRYMFDGSGRCVKAVFGSREWKFDGEKKGDIRDFMGI